VLLLAFASLGILLKYRLVSSPFGMIALAIREDETLTTATGRNVAAKKAVIFGIGAAYGALAGSLYASYITFIDPSTFTVTESVFILAIVILGGAGKLWGPLIGAAVMVTFPEMLRLTGIPGHLVGNLRQIMLGAVIVFLMLTRPQGLIGDFVFGGASKRGKSVDR
jgi:branched-chain amino acid transport system permease protein